MTDHADKFLVSDTISVLTQLSEYPEEAETQFLVFDFATKLPISTSPPDRSC